MEFGVFTTRLFRSITLEKESSAGFDQRYSNDNRLLARKFTERVSAKHKNYEKKLKQKLENIGGQYEYCTPLENWLDDKNRNKSYKVDRAKYVVDRDNYDVEKYWIIKYKMASDADKAFKRLERFYKDIQPSFISPRVNCKRFFFAKLWKCPSCMKNDGGNSSKGGWRHTNLLYVVAFISVFISSAMLFVLTFYDFKKNDTSTPKVCFLSYIANAIIKSYTCHILPSFYTG